MDALEAIFTRRSVRRYTAQDISTEQIETLIQVGLCAPSAHNEQPWHFIVIRDRTILDEIPNIHPYSQMLKQAPAAICVCADETLEKDSGSGYWVQDCAAATENILIAANALGLGACWLGVHPRLPRIEAIKTLLRLPDSITPFCLIALGYPDQAGQTAHRERPQRVHHNHW